MLSSDLNQLFFKHKRRAHDVYSRFRVAEVGSPLAWQKWPKTLVRRVFVIFAMNASFLRVIVNLQNQFSII